MSHFRQLLGLSFPSHNLRVQNPAQNNNTAFVKNQQNYSTISTIKLNTCR